MHLHLSKTCKNLKVALTMATLPLMMTSMSITAYAQSLSHKVNLESATVFLRGAELFSTGKVSLPAGESEIILSNVAGRLNEQSLSISADNGVMVLSRTVRRNYLVDEELSPRAKEIQSLLDEQEQKLGNLNIQLKVIQEQLKILNNNQQLVQGDGSLKPEELEKMLNLVGERMLLCLEKQTQLTREISKTDEEISKLEQQLNEEQSKDYQPGGQIVVKFYAPTATTSNIHMSYVVNDAGWVPAYDLTVTKFGEPIQLTYKADVFQNTGIDWTKVKLILSTGNPSQGVQMPSMYPWTLSVFEPSPQVTSSLGNSSLQYYDAKDIEFVLEAAAPPPTMAAGRLNQRVQSNTLDGYVTTNAQGINTTFNIAIPYTIPSDGKGHMILIQNAEVEAQYRYVVTPKLDPDVFLQAQVTEWEGLNILPGLTNIYYDNSFIGQGTIDLNQIKSGLDLSLGRDKRVIVERVEDTNNQGTAGFFGGSAQRTFAYTIKLHNTRPDAVKLEILDQLPVSRDSKITLTNLQLAGATHNKNTGEIKWAVELMPNEKRDITYSFAIEYPKERQINGL